MISWAFTDRYLGSYGSPHDRGVLYLTHQWLVMRMLEAT